MAARAATPANQREPVGAGDSAEELTLWIQNAIGWLFVRQPFFAFFLMRTPIYASRRVETASTDGVRIYVNPDFFARLSGAQRAFVLLHEAAHILLMHVPRLKRFHQKMGGELVNLVADAKANQIITEVMPEMEHSAELAPVFPATLTQLFQLDKEFVENASAEEILEEIARRLPRAPRRGAIVDGPLGGWQPPRGREPGGGWGGRQPSGEPAPGEPSEEEKGGAQRGPLDGDIIKAPSEPSEEDEVLNPGDEEGEPGTPRSPEREVERVKRRILESWAAAKAAGRVPAALERAVKELLKPKVDWRRLLRTFMSELLGGPYVRRTWSRPSRKVPGVYPGTITYAPGKVVVLVDTSGSIGEKELQRFVSEVYAIVRDVASVHVIPWDAEAYDPIEIKYPGDVLKVKLTGGGGTVLGPALRLAEEEFGDAAAYVILSDWEIADINNPEVQERLKKMEPRLVAATVSRSPPKFIRRVVDLREAAGAPS
jgi:predicted metal-dependent peptidase